MPLSTIFRLIYCESVLLVEETGVQIKKKLYLSRTFELPLLCCSAGLTMGFESLFKVSGVSDVLSVCISNVGPMGTAHVGRACTKGGYR